MSSDNPGPTAVTLTSDFSLLYRSAGGAVATPGNPWPTIMYTFNNEVIAAGKYQIWRLGPGWNYGFPEQPENSNPPITYTQEMANDCEIAIYNCVLDRAIDVFVSYDTTLPAKESLTSPFAQSGSPIDSDIGGIPGAYARIAFPCTTNYLNTYDYDTDFQFLDYTYFYFQSTDGRVVC